ncbi:MAG: sigma-54 interaction domain-containing protein [Emergencia timonensis]|uniref:sigma-54 interaction domain-containing protein n=1 Tax=Emergencia timonensis TaxID=1776384 RepID=UPI0009EE1FB8|nr:sigma 54-interacting transcriptional regulator [Emergencia timonensis]WNX87418.1 sigma 54-interacting transcriptional regulator [Emergencia timonensis]
MVQSGKSVFEEKETKSAPVITLDHEIKIIRMNQAAADLFSQIYPDKTEVDFHGTKLCKLTGKLHRIETENDLIYTFSVRDRAFYAIPFHTISDTRKAFWAILLINKENEKINKRTAYHADLSKHFEEILEGSFDGILVTDKEGKVLFVNSSYERVAEIKKSEIEGRYMRDLINPVWMPESVAHIVAKEQTVVSKRQVVKSGRHIMVTGRPIFNQNGEIKMIVINARDITEIYNLTEELQRVRKNEREYMSRFSSPPATGDSEDALLAISEGMKQVLSLAGKVANFNTTILILGESGVGKEEVAKYIHQHSMRKEKPFITVNCGAIPGNLLESELFGYERGAFTGAMQNGKVGLIEAADGGTVFLDEVGEMPLDFQVKLLRFIQSKEIRRVGAIDSKIIDVRVLAATNRSLADMVEEGSFREDLYYRLNVVQIEIPPLRKRTDAILPLVAMFLKRYNKKYGQEKVLTYDIVKEMERFSWPGNVRQLKNIVENMVIVSNNEYLEPEDLPWNAQYKSDPIRKVIHCLADNEDLGLNEAIEELERLVLEKAKLTCGTTRKIAEKLKVNQSTIVRKMQKYHIE